MTLATAPIEFSLPNENIARQPVESIHGAGRDQVRLMVLDRSSGHIANATFQALEAFLTPGDVLVVNTSGTLPAAVATKTQDGESLMVHVASPVASDLWNVELRTLTPGGGTIPGPDLEKQTLPLPGGATLHLLARDRHSTRLWIASFDGVDAMDEYLNRHGQPIRYEPGPALPLAAYQTVFASEPGSAEMPSAARPFSEATVTRLVSRGVVIVPIVLHAGVSSYEAGEAPGVERFEVPAHTATVVNSLRATGSRVIAVGTTVVRALETVSDHTGMVHPGHGLTDVVVTQRSGIRAVDGLITGWHEPRSSHLNLLEAFVDRSLLGRVYEEAVDSGYRWHEFGDLLLILP